MEAEKQTFEVYKLNPETDSFDSTTGTLTIVDPEGTQLIITGLPVKEKNQ